MSKAKIKIFTFKFWMGFNAFVLLFLAVNIATVGVEIDSEIPFLIALAYLIYMSVYLSRNSLARALILLGIGFAGMLFYIGGLIFGLTPPGVRPLALAHIFFSLVLVAGVYAQAQRGSLFDRFGNFIKKAVNFILIYRVCIMARVNFDKIRARGFGGFNLDRISVDKKAD